VAPYIPWTDALYDQNTVNRWAAAASAAPHTEEVGQSVADALLQIASNGSLRPHIPDDAWALLNKRVSLPPVCRGRSLGNGLDVLLHVQGRGDVDILKSYYLHVWSEWDFLSDSVISEMETSIKEDFCGVEMRGHREDLIGRLDHVLAQLDKRMGYLSQEKSGVGEDAIKQAKEQYQKLKEALVKAGMEATGIITGSSPQAQ
jgi:hypothetical protein